MDRDSYLSFISWKDDVISAGYRISPVEIEETLADYARMSRMRASSVRQYRRARYSVKGVCQTHGQYRVVQFGPRDAQVSRQDRLAKYKYPRAVAFIDELPKTNTKRVIKYVSLSLHGGLQFYSM